MHLLDDTSLWIDRADEHLMDLDKVLIEFLNAQFKIASETFKTYPSEGGMPPFSFQGPEKDVPRKASVLVGEFVQALRRALDYMVFELAILDSGRAQSGTQFPIEDTEEGFRRKRKTYLKGINDTHAAAIERLQPYNGVYWTKTLATLSNKDKHRRLIIGSHVGVMTVHGGDYTAAEPGTAVIRATNQRTGHVEMHFRITSQIFLDDSLPVVKTLQELKAQVTDTIDVFKPEFERS